MVASRVRSRDGSFSSEARDLLYLQIEVGIAQRGRALLEVLWHAWRRRTRAARRALRGSSWRPLVEFLARERFEYLGRIARPPGPWRPSDAPIPEDSDVWDPA